MSSLKQLYLAGNGLKGNLDTVNLPNIKEFNINGNRLRGMLPPFFNNRAFTVFAMVNSAISDLSEESMNQYIESSIVAGRIRTSRPPWNKFNVKTVSGIPLSISSKLANDDNPRKVTVSSPVIGKRIIRDADYKVSNGLVNILE